LVVTVGVGWSDGVTTGSRVAASIVGVGVSVCGTDNAVSDCRGLGASSVGVGLDSRVGVGIAVGLSVAVGVGAAVGVGTDTGIGVAVRATGTDVGVALGSGTGVAVGLGVAVGSNKGFVTTKTSECSLASSDTKLKAAESNTMKRPSALIWAESDPR